MNDVFLFYFRYRCYYLMLLFILFSLYCKHNLFVCINVMMQIMLFSELLHMHRCYSAGHYNPCCTDVIVQGHYLFIFSSGMVCNNPSHRCGRLYFPMFLFNVGLLTLMYMASFIALAMLWSSLPIILKFSTDVMWPVLFWCLCIGDGAFRCSLYLSLKGPRWLPYVLLLTVNIVTSEPVYDIAFLLDVIFVFRWH